MGREGVIRAVVEEDRDGGEVGQDMEEIAAARNAGQGQLLARAKARAEVGDGGFGGEAARLQFEQANAPGVGVAMLLLAEQEAVGRTDMGARQDGFAVLENLAAVRRRRAAPFDHVQASAHLPEVLQTRHHFLAEVAAFGV